MKNTEIRNNTANNRKEEKKKNSIKTRITAIALSAITAVSVAGAAGTSAFAVEFEKDPNPAITKAISKLNYNPENVLSLKGESISGEKNAQRKTIVHNADGTITYVTKTKRTVDDASTSDFTFTNASTSECYPGALLIANEKLVEGNPELLKAPRNNIDLTIRGIGIKEGKSVGVEANPGNSTKITDAIESLRQNWDGKDATGEVTMDITKVSSEKQVAATLGLAAGAVKKLKLNYNQDYTAKKNNYVLSYKQVYYTLNAAMPQKPGELFREGADSTYILSRINNENPPVMVSSVDYGRQIMVNIQSEASANDIQAALKAAVSKTKVDICAKYKSVLENATFKYVVYGGSAAKTGELISTSDYSKLVNIIISESKYTKDTRTAPISYTTRFLKNGQIATAQMATDYEETTAVTRKAIPLTIFGTGINNRLHCGIVRVEGDKITGVNDDGSYKTEHVVIADVRLTSSGTSDKVPCIPADIDLKSVTVSFDYDGRLKTGFPADANCFHITSTKHGENIERVAIEIEGTSRLFFFGYDVEGYVWINKDVTANTSGRHKTTGEYARDFYIEDK